MATEDSVLVLLKTFANLTELYSSEVLGTSQDEKELRIIQRGVLLASFLQQSFGSEMFDI